MEILANSKNTDSQKTSFSNVKYNSIETKAIGTDSSSFRSSTRKVQNFSKNINNLEHSGPLLSSTDPKGPAPIIGSSLESYYFYLLSIESHFIPQNRLLANQDQVTPYMRAIFIKWLIEVQETCDFATETIFLAVNIIDRYSLKNQLYTQNYQLVGTAAFRLAVKYEGPASSHENNYFWETLTENAFSAADLAKMERSILASINYELCWASPLNFLHIYEAEFGLETQVVVECEKTLKKLLLDIEMYSQFKPSVVALATIFIHEQSDRLDNVTFDTSDLVNCIGQIIYSGCY